ncbi:hypothetical protein FACS1894109_07210 [Spirochaetia bacterium]|nr:hypothetical protein FACS1894109_07210 [Spirochaetia bacterium]
MPWVIQLNGENLKTVKEINGLQDAEIKKLSLRLVNSNINSIEILINQKNEVMSLIDKCRDINGSTKPVCRRIKKALETGVFEFDLLRQISGWFNTSKNGGKELGEIIKKLFYDETFERFTVYDNQQLVNNFRGIFLPWLIRVFQHVD